MAFPTFPHSWSAPTTCFDPTDVYAVIISRDSQDTDNVLWEYWYGVPTTTPTGDCLPPSYVTSAPYFGQTCPPGYRNAAAFRTTISSQEASATICCPGSEASFALSGSEGCESIYQDQTFIATFTDNTIGEQRMTTFSDQAEETLHAFGITIVSTTPMSLDTSTSSFDSTTSSSMVPSATTTSSSTSSGKSSGLSMGATVGIGIGTALGVVFLSLLGWLLYRRHAKKKPDDPVITRDTVRPVEPLGFTYGTAKAFPSPVAMMPEINHTHDPHQSQPQAHESPFPGADRPFSELPS
ncbi:hypothetical protein F4801DRAFT_66190 [Xylaria longipes]|nr:hypothetical protein F4801DRAFT_66190 [Xylaria longipes]RYC66090.1 hypothetical protein CHU98_g153 [Xylaria longipes]